MVTTIFGKEGVDFDLFCLERVIAKNLKIIKIDEKEVGEKEKWLIKKKIKKCQLDRKVTTQGCFWNRLDLKKLVTKVLKVPVDYYHKNRIS